MRPVLAPPPGGKVEPREAPTFSVVIAAYQAADTIGDAIGSALAQTLPASDVVVCDDGSTDELERSLAPYADRITFLRQTNSGEGAAKNAAVRAARGEFAVFLDADDVFLPERLEALAELAGARPDLDVLTTDAFLEVGGKVVRRCYDEGWTFETNDQRGAILQRNFVFGLAAVRRQTFLEGGGFDESLRYATDWDLWCRLILDGSRFGLVAEPLARYRLNPAALSAQRPALLRGRCDVLEKAAARPDLDAAERRQVTRALTAGRREALLAEAHEALIEKASHARVLAARVAGAPSMPLGTRLKAIVAAVAPGLAARRLKQARALHGVPGPAGVRFPL
jgi:glycosyl transferase family 2